ncbi:MAG: hypothetical protein ACE5K8_06725 [Candidatus Zixiibacteriota bacterium]
MATIKEIIAYLDDYLRRHNKPYLTAIEAARLLDRADILKDSIQRPGKPPSR